MRHRAGTNSDFPERYASRCTISALLKSVQAREASPPGSDESKRMPPEDLAARIVAAVAARKRTLVPGAGNKVFAALGRWLPSVTERGMRKAIYEQLP